MDPTRRLRQGTGTSSPTRCRTRWQLSCASAAWEARSIGSSGMSSWTSRCTETLTMPRAPTFVTPSFAGYFSGHSTFSRAAAEVLTGFTGSEYFPGGLGEWIVKAGSLKFEAGPSADVPLEWATYFDAADQAGLSRLYGGIHISADDLTGRQVGADCGKAAWALPQQYYCDR